MALRSTGSSTEYGGTGAIGYIAEPWTVLLAGSYSRRNIETERREYNSAIQFFQNEAEFDSHVEGFDERERADRLRLQLRVPL